MHAQLKHPPQATRLRPHQATPSHIQHPPVSLYGSTLKSSPSHSCSIFSSVLSMLRSLVATAPTAATFSRDSRMPQLHVLWSCQVQMEFSLLVVLKAWSVPQHTPFMYVCVYNRMPNTHHVQTDGFQAQIAGVLEAWRM